MPRFFLLQVTLNKLSVSADANELLFVDADTTDLVGQTLGTSDNASLENYWILILCSILLLLLWSCCFYWVRGFPDCRGWRAVAVVAGVAVLVGGEMIEGCRASTAMRRDVFSRASRLVLLYLPPPSLPPSLMFFVSLFLLDFSITTETVSSL